MQQTSQFSCPLADCSVFMPNVYKMLALVYNQRLNEHDDDWYSTAELTNRAKKEHLSEASLYMFFYDAINWFKRIMKNPF